ncbi:TetR/AcrR family transcriptional regulator [Nocardioides bruguierae]|uniref:TetR/AcrR family transcriptional regulator n=1 Tax=Nocardioides bruguierae TaxID=2945102 RepID=A0A9X2D468_9ACTN|nr:TetR/AcrR family transcriptional regulator [Nocardioides bruguierae]MCM0619003.1 TetR/AcrR family transcriptional regulator [Nocardioides bruguierae]
MTATSPTTNERVEQAATRLFAQRGFHGTGIRRLAQESGLTSASLYHWMGTKEELLARLMRSALERLTAEARAALAGAGEDPRDRLDALVRVHVRAHAERPEQTRVVDGELGALTPDARAGVVALRDEYEDLWRTVIEDGVDQGLLVVAQPDLARRAVLEMCSSVARWFRSDGDLGVAEVAEEHVSLARGALGAR